MPEKSYWHFTQANYRLAINAGKEALYYFCPVVIPLGIIAALFCQIFGWRAYLNGRLNT
jgi:hypothetical protein